MEHIYQQPNFGENWFTYPKLYSYFVNRLSNGSKIVEVVLSMSRSLQSMRPKVASSSTRSGE